MILEYKCLYKDFDKSIDIKYTKHFNFDLAKRKTGLSRHQYRNHHFSITQKP